MQKVIEKIMTDQEVIFEVNGGLGLAGNPRHLAGKHKWNEWAKRKYACKWEDIPYDDFEGWVRWWFGMIREQLGDDYKLIIRIFTHLACWGIPASLYKNLASGGITAEVHEPCLGKLYIILKVLKELDAELMITFLNNCSARDAGWDMRKYYSNDWLEKYHKPWIKTITEEIQMWEMQDIVTAEWCNEGHGTVEWEKRGYEFLRALGYETVCSSPERNFDGVLANVPFDHLWKHGLWTQKHWDIYFSRYHNNPRVLPSTDGYSDLSGGWATQHYQFDQLRYGRLCNPLWILKFMNALNGKNCAFNASGGVEKKEPNDRLIRDWANRIRDFKLTKQAFEI